MSEPNTNRDKLDQRVTNLESLFTHLEQTVSDLDGVVVDGHKKIVELSDKVDNLEKKIESQKHDFPDEIRDLLASILLLAKQNAQVPLYEILK